MNELDWRSADIQIDVKTNNVKDSNLFLRKFYNEIDKDISIGWNYQPYREGTTIFVGSCNFGDMWISYKERGKINRVYIATSNDVNHSIVLNALNAAIDEHHSLAKYHISLCFDTKDIFFGTMCRKEIEVMPKKQRNNNIITITFSVEAFGDFDMQYVVVQKINYLKHLLLAYTNISFETCGGCQSRKDYTYIENDWEPDDNQWIDCFFDERRARENVYLMQDFFDVFRTILDNDTYEKSMRLLLNSAQELFCAKLMICNIFKDGEYNIPGYVDIINTVLISALEPLSMIGKDKPQHCQLCGNIMYKISKSIQLLCEKYLGENVAKEISNIAYGHRSSFVHEGNPVTNEFYCGHCVPLINPNSGNEMLGAISSIDMNLFEFGTYIFRQVVHDLLVGDIPKR